MEQKAPAAMEGPQALAPGMLAAEKLVEPGPAMLKPGRSKGAPPVL